MQPMAGTCVAHFELSEKEFQRISRMVGELAGINLHDGKRELVKARLGKRLRLLGLSSYTEYMKYVEEDASGVELANMLDALSTNLTYFFRESQHLDYLSKDILPQMIAAAGRGPKKLRVWSAGCSSGEEPYSIAVVLMETLPDPSRWDVKILATDISGQVLAKARQGVYEEARFRDMPAAIRGRYFELADSGPPKRFRVCDQLRKMVHFARLNLMEPWPMRGPFDIIFCRNVMIYFDKPTQERIIHRFTDILSPGGVLFIGHSESLSGIQHKLRQVYPTVYRT
jgi:chemotaxis protein methyltransferase CheR